MELKSTSLLAYYYRWLFAELPKDFCTLFWNTLFGTVFLPFTATVAFIDKVFGISSLWTSTCIGRIVGGVLYWIAGLGLHTLGVVVITAMWLPGEETSAQSSAFIMSLSWWAYILIGLGFWVGVVLCLGILILAVWGIISISEWWARRQRSKPVSEMSPEEYQEYMRTYTTPKPKEPSKFKVVWNTFRNKYCTKIEWR